MGVKIDNYRGFDIEFQIHSESFTCEVSDAIKFEKGSYKKIQEAIDEYLKKNQSFKPFKVITKPISRYGGIGRGVYTVIGIRKDDRFIYQDDEGKKHQLSDYNEKDVILYEPEMEQQLVQIAYLETLVDDARKKVDEAKSKVKGITISQHRKTLGL